MATLSLIDAHRNIPAAQVCRTCPYASNRTAHLSTAQIIAASDIADVICQPDRPVLDLVVTAGDGDSRSLPGIYVADKAPPLILPDVANPDSIGILARQNRVVAHIESCNQKILPKCRNCANFVPDTIYVAYKGMGGREYPRPVVVGGHCKIPATGIQINGETVFCKPTPIPAARNIRASCDNCAFLMLHSPDNFDDELYTVLDLDITPYERHLVGELIEDYLAAQDAALKRPAGEYPGGEVLFSTPANPISPDVEGVVCINGDLISALPEFVEEFKVAPLLNLNYAIGRIRVLKAQVPRGVFQFFECIVVAQDEKTVTVSTRSARQRTFDRTDSEVEIIPHPRIPGVVFIGLLIGPRYPEFSPDYTTTPRRRSSAPLLDNWVEVDYNFLEWGRKVTATRRYPRRSEDRPSPVQTLLGPCWACKDAFDGVCYFHKKGPYRVPLNTPDPDGSDYDVVFATPWRSDGPDQSVSLTEQNQWWYISAQARWRWNDLEYRQRYLDALDAAAPGRSRIKLFNHARPTSREPFAPVCSLNLANPTQGFNFTDYWNDAFGTPRQDMSTNLLVEDDFGLIRGIGGRVINIAAAKDGLTGRGRLGLDPAFSWPKAQAAEEFLRTTSALDRPMWLRPSVSEMMAKQETRIIEGRKASVIKVDGVEYRVTYRPGAFDNFSPGIITTYNVFGDERNAVALHETKAFVDWLDELIEVKTANGRRWVSRREQVYGYSLGGFVRRSEMDLPTDANINIESDAGWACPACGWNGTTLSNDEVDVADPLCPECDNPLLAYDHSVRHERSIARVDADKIRAATGHHYVRLGVGDAVAPDSSRWLTSKRLQEMCCPNWRPRRGLGRVNYETAQ